MPKMMVVRRTQAATMMRFHEAKMVSPVLISSLTAPPVLSMPSGFRLPAVFSDSGMEPEMPACQIAKPE